jgi:hypothetical protein
MTRQQSGYCAQVTTMHARSSDNYRQVASYNLLFPTVANDGHGARVIRQAAANEIGRAHV